MLNDLWRISWLGYNLVKKSISGSMWLHFLTIQVTDNFGFVEQSVAYDRSSAPKNCRISGWIHDDKGTDVAADSEKMFLLTEFIYDLDKSNAQTFDVLESARSNLVDTVRFDFTSNHGKPHTCIYRLRVHGREPNSLVMQS